MRREAIGLPGHRVRQVPQTPANLIPRRTVREPPADAIPGKVLRARTAAKLHKRPFRKLAGLFFTVPVDPKPHQVEAQMYRQRHSQKTAFDYVVLHSEVERQFAELLDTREDINLIMKLPDSSISIPQLAHTTPPGQSSNKKTAKTRFI